MTRVVQRERARRDVIAQFVWYAEHANVEVARRFRRIAAETFRLMATQPFSGAVVPLDNVRELRRFPIGGGFGVILAYYRPIPDGIEVIRVLHASRDVRSVAARGELD